MNASPESTPSHSRQSWLLSLLVLAALPCALIWWKIQQPAEQPVLAATSSVPHANPAGTPDREDSTATGGNAAPAERSAEDHRKIALLLGEWDNHFHGPRHLTVRPDGTGEMISEPEGLGARLFAAKMRFDINWTLRGDEIVLETIGGEPEAKVKLVLRMFGDRRVHTIDKLDETEMILVDDDGETKHTWTRSPPKSAEPPEDALEESGNDAAQVGERSE